MISDIAKLFNCTSLNERTFLCLADFLTQIFVRAVAVFILKRLKRHFSGVNKIFGKSE
jgi:hypothetical protein